MKLNVVLFHPEIPQNTGNIMRTCVGVGAKLHLIKPLGFSLDEKHLRRSAVDYYEFIEYEVYENYDDFIRQNANCELFFFSAHGKNSYAEIDYPDNAFLVFGRESVGLPKELIEENYERSVRIPMRKTLRCLNLSNSVAIAVYEVLRQNDFSGLE